MKKGYIPSEQVGLKKEFKNRLLYLQKELNRAIESDNADLGLMPALASVFSWLWSNLNQPWLKRKC